MKAVFLGSDAQIAQMAKLALCLRWPDAEFIIATADEGGLELIEQKVPNIVFYQPASGGMRLRKTIQALRHFSQVPLMVLTHQKNDMELVTSLSIGADDYVEATCSLTMLTAKIMALLRRFTSQDLSTLGKEVLLSGELLVSPSTYEVYLGHRRVKVSKTEFLLLLVLVENRGSVVTHGRLKYALWRDQDSDNELLKKHVGRLRQKLGDNARAPHWIASVNAVGYRFIGPTPVHLDSTNPVLQSLVSSNGNIDSEGLVQTQEMAPNRVTGPGGS